jgi:hypothetical protein
LFELHADVEKVKPLKYLIAPSFGGRRRSKGTLWEGTLGGEGLILDDKHLGDGVYIYLYFYLLLLKDWRQNPLISKTIKTYIIHDSSIKL